MIESINLNLIPSGVSPVCHVSQYDAGRQIKINLFEGINPYTIQSGDAFTLNVRKPDNTIVTTSVSGTQGDNHITISTTEQIAAVVGENLCELKITNGSTVIGTLNFIMLVERDVLADGVPSQSVIEDLDERIAEAIGDNYYNKTETDTLLNDKADKSDTYTKTETDSLLALKADKSDTYTKTETDALLALKADKSELYNVYPTEQESGSIAHITDGADNIPVKSLVSEIVAIQSGSGTPSPDNEREIIGFDKGVITRCGVNLCDEVFETGDISFATGGNITGASWIRSTNYMPIVSGSTIYVKSTQNINMFFYDCNKAYLGNNSEGLKSNVKNTEITISSKARYFRIATNQTPYNHDISINYPSTDTQYHAYNGNTYTFAFGQTVYGGHFDNKGNLVVTHIIVDMGDFDWTYLAVDDFYVFGYRFGDKALTHNEMCSCYKVTAKSRQSLLNYELGTYNLTNALNYVVIRNDDYTDATAFKTAMNGQKLVYELANPITLSITSQDIPTLLGENNIYSDTGDVDVTIRADIGLYIDKRISANRSTPNNLNRAAAYVDDPESVNESQEDNVEPQNEER